MKLYGTYTSPFVRRVRIVAEEVGAPYTLVDVSKEDGQAALRAITPIWKVPVAELAKDPSGGATDAEVILDSHVIIDYLLEAYGHRNLRSPTGAERWRERNLMSVIDGALESAINVFYIRRDGGDVDRVGYLVKQRARVESAMDWLERQLTDGWFGAERKLGLSEIAFMTAIDWMSFREVYDIERHAAIRSFRAAHGHVASFLSTVPRL